MSGLVFDWAWRSAPGQTNAAEVKGHKDAIAKELHVFAGGSERFALVRAAASYTTLHRAAKHGPVAKCLASKASTDSLPQKINNGEIVFIGRAYRARKSLATFGRFRILGDFHPTWGRATSISTSEISTVVTKSIFGAALGRAFTMPRIRLIALARRGHLFASRYRRPLRKLRPTHQPPSRMYQAQSYDSPPRRYLSIGLRHGWSQPMGRFRHWARFSSAEPPYRLRLPPRGDCVGPPASQPLRPAARNVRIRGYCAAHARSGIALFPARYHTCCACIGAVLPTMSISLKYFRTPGRKSPNR